MPDEPAADDGGLSEQEKLTVLHAATSRLIDLLADDPGVQKLSRAFPDEITRTFLAGCQAGADSALRVLQLQVDS